MIVMPSDRKELYVEFFWINGTPPFICGADGAFTISVLEEIEAQLLDGCTAEECFGKGEGQYLYKAFYEKAEYEGPYMTHPAYWDLTEISFKAVDA